MKYRFNIETVKLFGLIKINSNDGENQSNSKYS